MTIPLDTLRVGDVVIVSEHYDADAPFTDSPLGFFPKPVASFNGKPWRVLAINLRSPRPIDVADELSAADPAAAS